jgi:hypothetical protein
MPVQTDKLSIREPNGEFLFNKWINHGIMKNKVNIAESKYVLMIVDRLVSFGEKRPVIKKIRQRGSKKNAVCKSRYAAMDIDIPKNNPSVFQLDVLELSHILVNAMATNGIPKEIK